MASALVHLGTNQSQHTEKPSILIKTRKRHVANTIGTVGPSPIYNIRSTSIWSTVEWM